MLRDLQTKMTVEDVRQLRMTAKVFKDYHRINAAIDKTREKSREVLRQLRLTIDGCHGTQRKYDDALQDFDARCDLRIKKEVERLDKTKVSGYFQVNDSLVSGKKRDMAGFRDAYNKSPTRFSSVTYDFNSERESITSSPKSLRRRDL